MPEEEMSPQMALINGLAQELLILAAAYTDRSPAARQLRAAPENTNALGGDGAGPAACGGKRLNAKGDMSMTVRGASYASPG